MGIKPKEKNVSYPPTTILHGALELIGSNQALPTTIMVESFCS
jgi:hypothetical protein